MIKSVIFDFGGVLMRTHDQSGRRKWETRLGLEPGGAAQLVFGSELGRKAQLGQARPEEIWTWLGNHLDLGADDLAAFRRDFWAGDRVDRALADTIRALRARYRTGLLSNSWARDGQAMAESVGLADCFDVFVTSAELGVMKPDPRIYQVALERLGVTAPEAIFVDDFIENVEAARGLGMQAIHFTDPDQVRLRLQELLKP